MTLRQLSAAGCVALTAGVVGAGLVSIALALPAPAATVPARHVPAGTGPGGALQAQLNTLAASVLGPNRAVVSVTLTLDRRERHLSALSYGKRATTLQSSLATASATGSTRKSAFRAYGHNEQLVTTTVTPGAVKRIQLAVIVDASVPARTVTALRRELAVAAGLQRGRGDRLSITRVRFAPTRTSVGPPMGSPQVRSFLSCARWVLLVAGALAFAWLSTLALQGRPLKQTSS